jgi:hypothetical protein
VWLLLQVYEYSFSINMGHGGEREFEFLCESEQERWFLVLCSEFAANVDDQSAWFLHDACCLVGINWIAQRVRFPRLISQNARRDEWIMDLRITANRWSQSPYKGLQLVDMLQRKKRNVTSWLMASFSQGRLP